MMTWQESVAWRPEHPGHSDDILPFYAWLASLIPDRGWFVECGVYLGRSIAFMGEIRPDLSLFAVDPWTKESLAASGDGTYEQFCHLMSMHHALTWERLMIHQGTLAQCTGINADAIFLDGDHNFPGVRADIATARLMVRPGGIIAGHDYAGNNGVVKAVHEAFGEPNVSDWDGPELPGAPVGKGRCWWVQL